MSSSVFISADELAEAQADPRLLILDVRFDPHGPAEGRPEYDKGHIPGALFVDLQTELQARPVMGKGRRPLPEIEALSETVQRWGVRGDTDIVVYDDRSGVSSGRAWWVLRWAGLDRVRILDGGLASWVRAGRTLTTEEPATPIGGDVRLSAGHLPQLDEDAVMAFAAEGRLFDARVADEYLAGHIPAAQSRPAESLLNADGTIPEPEVIRERFAAGADTTGAERAGNVEVGTYCGGGVAGAFEVALLEHAGITAALYPGSWSAWSKQPDRPHATGPEPGAAQLQPSNS
jgi:thiosulfate/3-mercaptopyruvate sulfurtransferase